MSRELIGILTLAVVVVVLLTAMRAGWRRRRRRTAASIGPLPEASDPEALGELRAGPVEAIYVSTTYAGQPFERIVAHGLGARGRAEVTVHDAGVLIARTGAPEVFVPTAALRAVGRSPGMAGSVVGRDGLVVITWVLGTQVLDTGLRTRFAADRQMLADAVADLAPSDAPSNPTGQENV